MKDKYRTAAYIDLDAIVSNIKEVKRRIDPKTKVMAIIKADAYGHGALPVAHRLDEEKGLVDAYGVAVVEEGEKLRQGGIEKPILLLGYTAPELLESVVDNRLTQAVYTYDTAKALSDICVRNGKNVDIHIKIDTGMGRIGFAPNDAGLEEILRISELPRVEITGAFSHLSRADETDKTYSRRQFEIFKEFTARIEAAGIELQTKHISNSAAACELPEMNLDMVRLGIVIYGLYPSEECDKNLVSLRPALEWKSRISYVKDVEEGAQISYGGTFVAPGPMRIATIPVGYADGYPRALSGKGRVLIRGQYAPILGRVCMDQFMVDVSKIPEAEIGDSVTLVGRDGGRVIPIEEPAGLSGSFNYEFACDIGGRVSRVYMSRE